MIFYYTVITVYLLIGAAHLALPRWVLLSRVD